MLHPPSEEQLSHGGNDFLLEVRGGGGVSPVAHGHPLPCDAEEAEGHSWGKGHCNQSCPALRTPRKVTNQTRRSFVRLMLVSPTERGSLMGPGGIGGVDGTPKDRDELRPSSKEESVSPRLQKVDINSVEKWVN